VYEIRNKNRKDSMIGKKQQLKKSESDHYNLILYYLDSKSNFLKKIDIEKLFI
jgi:hypothetical protein